MAEYSYHSVARAIMRGDVFGAYGDGSIVVILRKAFLNVLKPGTYTLRARLTGSGTYGRYVQTTIQVLSGAAPPKTRDNGTPLLRLALCAVGAMGIIPMMRRRRREILRASGAYCMRAKRK